MNERRDKRKQTALRLRRMAEIRLADDAASVPPPPSTAEQLLHELQVHQIELEMQNEALRSTQNALEESHDRYFDLYEMAPVGYLTLTHTGRIATVNLAGATLLGIERSNLLQQYFSKFVIPRDSDRWHLLFARAMGQSEQIGIELTLRRIGGVTLDVHLDCLRTQAPGAAPELRVTLSDISAMQLNKQMLAAQDDLREQLLFQTSLLESIPVPVYYKDFGGRYLGCNRAFEEVLGKSRAEFIGKSVFDMAPPEIADTYRAKDAELFEQPGKQMYEWVIRKPDGEIRNVQFHKASFVRNDGTVGGLIGALVDITELKRKDAALEESEERLRATMEATRDAVVLLEGDSGAITVWNPAAEAIFGFARVEVLGQSLHEFLVPSRFREQARRALAHFSLSGEGEAVGTTRELLAMHKNGTEFPIELSLSAMRIRGKWFAIGIARDITQRKQAHAALQQANRQNEIILESVEEGILGVEFDGHIRFINPAALAMLGYARDEVLGREFHAVLHHEMSDGSPCRHEACLLYQTVHSEHSVRAKEETLSRKDGTTFPVLFSSTPTRDDVRVIGAVIAFQDITNLKRYQGQLERQANYDGLTGLPNRNLLTDRLAYLVARRQREQKKLAVLVLNLNRFREINDSLGRAAGDSVLKETSQRLSKLLRKMDTLARLEGDEFVLALEVADDAEDEAAFIARRIQDALALPMYLDGREISLQVSVGISILPRDGGNGETLLNNALVAMHRIKGSGTSHFLFYATEMNADVQARFNLGNELRHAVERDELLLHYQPKLDLRNGEIIGMEALVRWQHPLRGMVSPAEFIPLAEAIGLIVSIGEWVMRTACLQNQAWHAAGLHTVPVAVNLSALQFQAQDIVALTAQILKETGLDARYLELELTESTAMTDAEAFVGITERFKALSINLSIDDFGTGYSSLSYLKRFAVDRLKIDQSFVRDIVLDPGSAAISVAIITLAHSLGLSVIAEGVETQAQLNFLRSHGCDEMQGYYFSKPLPATEFEQLLRSGRKLSLTSSADRPGNTLLLVDDEPSILSALSRLFRHEGYRIHTATSGQIALELLATHEVGVVISDQRMPHMTGAEFLARVRVMYPDTVRIILSGYTELSALTEVVNRGEVYKFLEKPWDDAALRQTLHDAFRLYEARRAVRDK